MCPTKSLEETMLTFLELFSEGISGNYHRNALVVPDGFSHWCCGNSILPAKVYASIP